MNHISALFSRRFPKIKKLGRRPNDNRPLKAGQDSIGNTQLKFGPPKEKYEELDETINWCPAPEYLKREAYSFVLPEYEQAADGQGFKIILDLLTKQLEEHVSQANTLIENNEKTAELSESIEENLRVAIGRTQLLLNKRFKQFREQLERHLHPIVDQKPTKIDDLRGLWDLIEMQLDDLRRCFSLIEQCRLNNWQQQ